MNVLQPGGSDAVVEAGGAATFAVRFRAAVLMATHAAGR